MSDGPSREPIMQDVYDATDSAISAAKDIAARLHGVVSAAVGVPPTPDLEKSPTPVPSTWIHTELSKLRQLETLHNDIARYVGRLQDAYQVAPPPVPGIGRAR